MFSHRHALPSHPRWMRVVASILLVGLITLFTGCGSSSTDFVATGTSSGSTTQPADGFYMGRVYLDTYGEGNEVLIKDLQGNTIETLTTRSLGIFYSYRLLPRDFRIEAIRPGEGVVHSREIRGGYGGGTMYINPLTTLASRYLSRHPEATLEQANEKIRAYFELPANLPFDWVTNAKVSPFRPVVFYQEAATFGGVEEYYEYILAQIESPTRNAEVAESTASKLAKEVAGDILGDAVSLVDAGVFGAVTQAFGLNLGTSGALNAISEQLDQVLSELSDLETEVATSSITGQYKSDLTALADPLNRIQNYLRALQVAASGGSVSLDFSTLLQVEDDMDALRGFLVDTPAGGTAVATDNIIYTYAEYASANGVTNPDNNITYKMKLSDTTSAQSYAVRINGMTEMLQKNLGIYLNYLSQAINNRSELAHMSVPPASALNAAIADIEDATADSFQAAAQVPELLPSDDFLVDLQNGQMWVASFQSQSNYYDANNLCNNFSEAGYDDWGLPSRDQITGLVQNRINNAKSGDSNSGWEDGFKAFGFDTTHYGEQKYDGGSGLFGNTNVQGQAFFDVDTDSGANNQNVYQWSGVNSAPATSFYDTEQGDTLYSSTFLICRVYAHDTESSNSTNVLAYATLPNSNELQLSVNGNQLSATCIFDAKGVTTPRVSVTNRVYWQNVSSDAATKAMATISNYPGDSSDSAVDLGPQGFITWHPPIDGSPLQPVTIQGTLWGPSYGGSSGAGGQSVGKFTQTITVNPPTNLTPNATSLQVLPYQYISSTEGAVNNEFDVAVLSSNNQAYDIYATTFYEDGQFHDVTGSATYTFLDSQNNVIASTPAGGGFIDSTPNRLLLNSSLPAGTYTIRSTYTTPTGQNLTGTIPFIVNNVTN